MALRKRSLTADLVWLKWQLGVLFLLLVLALTVYLLSFNFRNNMQRQEFQALANLDLLLGQVREIENAERIIVNNIDRFNAMVAGSVLEQEDRVALLEEIREIRERHDLFPIAVEIREQDRILLNYGPDVETPQEQVSLRSSQIQVRFPLLHEEDLQRFLDDFTSGGRLLVTSRCAIDEIRRADNESPELGEYQMASCDFNWLTLRREPFSGI